jgi:hypothetical protein
MQIYVIGILASDPTVSDGTRGWPIGTGWPVVDPFGVEILVFSRID